MGLMEPEICSKMLKARLHRRFLSQQLDAIFVALKLQLQNRRCKPGVTFSAICRRDIAGVSNMFETWCDFAATKIASSSCDKNRLCKRALRYMSEKLGAKFPATTRGYSMVKIAQLDFAFSEFFELEANPVEGQWLQQKKKKEKR